MEKKNKKKTSVPNRESLWYLTDEDKEEQTPRHRPLLSELISPAWMWQTAQPSSIVVIHSDQPELLRLHDCIIVLWHPEPNSGV